MQLVHRKGFAAIYWVVAFLVTVGGIVLGGHLGNGGAPEFGDGTTGASAGSHLLFAIGGAIVGGLLALALFSALWIALWASARRAGGVAEDDGEYGGLDELEDIDDEGHEDVDGSDGEEDDLDGVREYSSLERRPVRQD